ncbi:signal peptidase subunit Spc3 [Schizosaccharomyces japonicus yFS275]|uniref:Signal peptidase subunit 3 n=1 Tax=Schizosaccharomyces japonicus (strain yFS275 / FY16936) TaxID=402676 RepID=B6K2T9_SCHJY|nr:signal peptidase subunit Spc3 [Schizosaccharomyces japonicus yFS275]EEB08579.1 signal peptidase subunit Spc3 [Schizosaccharomyces japonicus yFS275]
MCMLNSSYGRFQAVFSRLNQALGVLIILVFVLSGFTNPGDLDVDPVHIYSAKYRIARFSHAFHGKRQQYAQVNFDVDADLTPLWNWNTKDVVVYVVASYTTPENQCMLSLKNVYTDSISHPFHEYSNSFANKEANYSLHWTVSPKIGLLTWGKSASSSAPVSFLPVVRKKKTTKHSSKTSNTASSADR